MSALAARSSATRLLVLRGTQHRFLGLKKPEMPLPTPPEEKKWFYKQVWSALRQETGPKALQDPTTSSPNPSSPGASSGTNKWLQPLYNVREQGSKFVTQYGVQDKFEKMFSHYCRFVASVKDFFYQKRYRNMGSLVDDGLKSLEDKLRAAREGRVAARAATERGLQPSGAKQLDGDCKKKDVVVKLQPQDHQKNP